MGEPEPGAASAKKTVRALGCAVKVLAVRGWANLMAGILGLPPFGNGRVGRRGAMEFPPVLSWRSVESAVDYFLAQALIWAMAAIPVIAVWAVAVTLATTAKVLKQHWQLHPQPC